MERMGDILAKTVVRRAQRAQQPLPPSDAEPPEADSMPNMPGTMARPRPAAPSRPLASPRRAQTGAPARGARPLAPTPQPQQPQPRSTRATPPPASVGSSTPGTLRRPDLIETPPGLAGPPTSTLRLTPADVRSDSMDADRILELPPRRASGPSARATLPSAQRTTGSARLIPAASSTLRPGDAGAGAGSSNRTSRASASAIGPQGAPTPSRAAARENGFSSPPRGAEGSTQRSLPSSPRRPSEGTGARMSGGVRENASGYAAADPDARTSGARRAAPGPDVCPLCGGAGYLREDVPLGDPGFGRAMRCECKEREIKQRERLEIHRRSGLDLFRDKIFDTFDSSIQGTEEAFQVARDFATDHRKWSWLVLSGPRGVGKTHLAAAIANQLFDEGNVVYFQIVPDLLDHLRAAFAPSSEIAYDELFDKIREAYLLVLDDLGAENSTAWATEKLFQLVNYRYNARMPTVISTNARLFTQMDERLRSRLSDIGLVRHVAIKAQDYREHRARRPGSGSRAR